MTGSARTAADARLTWVDLLRDAALGVTDAAALPSGMLALARVPKGDGHAVVVFPGFLSTDQPTWPLRWFLARAGYRAFAWGLGTNYGFSNDHPYDIEALIEQRLKEVIVESGDRRITLIGWSLGGVYAKELARRYPQLVRDVITLGSPIRGNTAEVSVWQIYEWVTNMRFSDPAFARKLRALATPVEGVPITAFYSRSDGVVPWQNACEKPGPLVQNVEVKATHVGMGFDAFVWYVIAHRLARSGTSAAGPPPRPPGRPKGAAAPESSNGESSGAFHSGTRPHGEERRAATFGGGHPERWQPLDVAHLWRRFRKERALL